MVLRRELRSEARGRVCTELVLVLGMRRSLTQDFPCLITSRLTMLIDACTLQIRRGRSVLAGSV